MNDALEIENEALTRDVNNVSNSTRSSATLPNVIVLSVVAPWRVVGSFREY